MNLAVKKITFTAVMTALAIVLSIVESFIPSFGIPGIKLGLANIAILIMLYAYGWQYAVIVNLLRVFLASILRGTIFQMGFFMSFSGAALSLLIMILLKILIKKLNIITVSVVGSVFHIIGQIAVAFIFTENWGIIYYFPFIMLSAIITGIIVGIAASRSLILIKLATK